MLLLTNQISGALLVEKLLSIPSYSTFLTETENLSPPKKKVFLSHIKIMAMKRNEVLCQI
jgi:hypothetical protein